jgi:hypothetical protein
VLNAWLNLYRPCLYATEGVSDKGTIKQVYAHKDTKTPLACVVLLHAAGLVTFKSATMLESLLVSDK